MVVDESNVCSFLNQLLTNMNDGYCQFQINLLSCCFLLHSWYLTCFINPFAAKDNLNYVIAAPSLKFHRKRTQVFVYRKTLTMINLDYLCWTQNARVSIAFDKFFFFLDSIMIASWNGFNYIHKCPENMSWILFLLLL